jgi:hypothetical protein
MSRTTGKSSATARQLRYLHVLSQQTGTTFTYPHTREQASVEIDRLRRLKTAGRPLPLRELSIATDANVYATAVQAEEVSGFGSSARWRTNTAVEPDAIAPRGSRFGARIELARYTVSDGPRVLCSQRYDGAIRLIDRSASGAGSSYLVERDLHQENEDALCALVADYLRQARELDEIPMKSSAVRRELERAATQ